jgi:hypothetical protein
MRRKSKGFRGGTKAPRASKAATAAAFHEVKHNPPKILAHTRDKFGAADAKRQAVAIALHKAAKGDA